MTMGDEYHDRAELTSTAADIVSAYVSNNPVPVAELPKLINDIYAVLQKIGTKVAEPVIKQEPAIAVRKSVTPDFIACLEDGKKFKSLKRHLNTHYNLSPDQYRQKWGLPPDYPMVAPNYAAARSAMAKAIGLGRKVATKSKKTSRPLSAATVSSATKARNKTSAGK